MKKQNVVNLVKYHSQGDNKAFNNEVLIIAKDFIDSGDNEIGQYLLSQIKSIDSFKVQDLTYDDFQFLVKDKKTPTSVLFPNDLINDIMSISRSISKKNGIHRFLFVGKPGTGKTEACRHIARITKRTLLTVNIENLVDSHLGQTPKNIVSLFNEMNKVVFENVIFLFDEIDSLVMDRINDNDLREMGRATSSFLKQLDELDNEAVIIGTTNLQNKLDEALKRRFEAIISFDRYSYEDLYEIADSYFHELFNEYDDFKYDSRLIHKIIKLSDKKPSPAELRNVIRLSVLLSEDKTYNYLKGMFQNLCPNLDITDLALLSEKGFNLSEIEKISSISKSTLSRRLKSLEV